MKKAIITTSIMLMLAFLALMNATERGTARQESLRQQPDGPSSGRVSPISQAAPVYE
jgi:hypothetical protein